MYSLQSVKRCDHRECIACIIIVVIHALKLRKMWYRYTVSVTLQGTPGFLLLLLCIYVHFYGFDLYVLYPLPGTVGTVLVGRTYGTGTLHQYPVPIIVPGYPYPGGRVQSLLGVRVLVVPGTGTGTVGSLLSVKVSPFIVIFLISRSR